MAPHSSTLVWRISGMEPGGLPSMGSHWVVHDWHDLAAAAAEYLDNSMCVQSPSHVQFLATSWNVLTRFPCSSLSSAVCSSSCLLTRWCHPTILSSATLFFSCPQSFPASGFFPVSWIFASGGQSIAASASAASVLPMNIQGWFPLRLTGLISVANSHWICKCMAMKLAILQIYGERQS